MGQNERVASLMAELNKAASEINRSVVFHRQFRQDFPVDQPSVHNYDLVILADIISDQYTCLETAFVRISKFFANNLDKDRWHKHLLEKMSLEIPGIRPRVLSEESFQLLDEFLRFRHFKRYYYDYRYDRDRMVFLEKKLLNPFHWFPGI